MVSIALGVLCAVCTVMSYLVATKLKLHTFGSSLDDKTANAYSLTTDELSRHHYAKQKSLLAGSKP